MAFKVAFEFSDPDDLIDLIAKVAVPAHGVSSIIAALSSVHEEITVMSVAFDALKAEVAATRGAMDSATTLIEGIAARIEANREDPEALMAMVADLRKDREELSTAVAQDQASQNPPQDTVGGGSDTVPAGDDTVPGTGEQPGEGVPPDATQPDTGTTVPPTTDPGSFPQV